MEKVDWKSTCQKLGYKRIAYMKILQINAVYGRLSTGRTCLEMKKELEKRGHQCYTAYAMHLNDFPQTFVIGNSFDRKIHAAYSQFIGLQGYCSTRATKKLIKYIEKEKFDIVHLRNLHNNFINLKILLKFLSQKNIPTVITLHDCWMFTGKCMHYTQKKCFKWQEDCGGCEFLSLDMPSRFFDFTKKMLHDKKKWLMENKNLAIVGVSNWVTNEAKKSILKDAKIISRIYNWIDLSAFTYTPNNIKELLGIQDKKVVLGVSSGWTASKGIDEIEKLANMMADDVVIVLVGKMLYNYSLPPNVILLDQTDDTKKLAQYYSMADCFISLSREETFGKTIAEALACGTPAVTFDTTALTELVLNGCGYTVGINDIDDFCDKINLVLREGKAKFSDNCRKRAEKDFDMEKNILEYLKIYEMLMKEAL